MRSTGGCIALIGGGLFVDVYDQTLAGAVLAALVKSGEFNLTLNGWFLSSTFLGLMIGAWIAGVMSDRFGRRVSFQINLLIFGVFSVAAAFAPSMTLADRPALPDEYRPRRRGGRRGGDADGIRAGQPARQDDRRAVAVQPNLDAAAPILPVRN